MLLRIILPVLAALLVGTLGIGVAYGPRLIEATLFLQDVAAGDGPSRLKQTRPIPASKDITYTVDGRERAADLYRAGQAPRAALVLVPGLTPRGKDDPRLKSFARSLARARFQVLVPDMPGLRELRVAPEDAVLIADALANAHQGLPPDRPVGVIAVSFAAGPAVAALARPGVADGVDFAVLVGPYFDLEAAITFATTGAFRDGADAPWQTRAPNDYGKWAIATSLAEALDQHDRALLRAMARRRLSDSQADIADLAARLDPPGRSVLAVIENQDPDRVASLVASLPDSVRAVMASLDPESLDPGTLDLRWVLIHGADDPFLPETESRAFARALPAGRVDHFEPSGLTHVDLAPKQGIGGLTLLRAAARVLELADHGD